MGCLTNASFAVLNLSGISRTGDTRNWIRTKFHTDSMDSINHLIQQWVSQEVCVPDHLSWGWILFPGKYKGEYPVEEDREKHCFSC